MALMVDAAVGERETARAAGGERRAATAGADGPPDGWRAALEAWAQDLFAVLLAHPWALDVDPSRTPMGPNRAGWLEDGLQALATTGLDEGTKAHIVLLLSTFTFGEARLAVDLGGAGEGAGAFDVLARVVDAERLPALRRAIDAQVFADDAADAPGEHFAFGLERVLDGVQRLVEGPAS